MKRSKPGKRHPLLVYRRAWGRLWKNSLSVGILLGVLWAVIYFMMPSLEPIYEILLLIVAFLTLILGVVAFLLRNLAYVRAYPDHIQIVTPVFQVKVSYRRVRSVRPMDLAQIFPPQKARGIERSLLEPYYGMTAVVIEMNSYPLKAGVLRFFLPDVMLLPKSTGLVLVVKDWMALSTDIDSFRGAFGQERELRPVSGFGIQSKPRRK